MLGSGVVGMNAARMAMGLNAEVVVLEADRHLAKGLNVLKGEITHPAVAQALGKPFVDPFGAWGA